MLETNINAAPNRAHLPPSPWTDERVVLLKKMLGDGDSASEIARAIGTTRNSVLGKLHRLGLAEELTLIWTKAVVARLIKLWRDGMSYRQIAAELGLSRNTVMGKGVRLKLSKIYPRARVTPVSRGKAGANSDRAATQRIAAKLLKVRHPQNGGVAEVNLVVRDEGPRRADFLCVGLLDLEKHHCRFPRGGDEGEPITFCGQPKMDGESYCLAHHRIAYNAPKPRIERPYHPTGGTRPAVF